MGTWAPSDTFPPTISTDAPNGPKGVPTGAPSDTWPPTNAITTAHPVPSPTSAPTFAPSMTWPPTEAFTTEKAPTNDKGDSQPSPPTFSPTTTWPPTGWIPRDENSIFNNQ